MPVDTLKFLYRLKFRSRAVATWLETASRQAMPKVGDRINLGEHLARLPLTSPFGRIATVTGISTARGLGVVYIEARPNRRPSF